MPIWTVKCAWAKEQPVLEAARAESARHAGDAAQLDLLAGQATQAKAALAAYDEIAGFDAVGIDPYQPL